MAKGSTCNFKFRLAGDERVVRCIDAIPECDIFVGNVIQIGEMEERIV